MTSPITNMVRNATDRSRYTATYTRPAATTSATDYSIAAMINGQLLPRFPLTLRATITAVTLSVPNSVLSVSPMPAQLGKAVTVTIDARDSQIPTSGNWLAPDPQSAFEVSWWQNGTTNPAARLTLTDLGNGTASTQITFTALGSYQIKAVSPTNATVNARNSQITLSVVEAAVLTDLRICDLGHRVPDGASPYFDVQPVDQRGNDMPYQASYASRIRYMLKFASNLTTRIVDGRLRVSYTSTQSLSDYGMLRLWLDDKDVTSSPFIFSCNSSTGGMNNSYARQISHTRGAVSSLRVFAARSVPMTLTSPGYNARRWAGGDVITATSDIADKTQWPFTVLGVTDMRDGSYVIRYIPLAAATSDYVMRIRVDGQEINGSPFVLPLSAYPASPAMTVEPSVPPSIFMDIEGSLRVLRPSAPGTSFPPIVDVAGYIYPTNPDLPARMGPIPLVDGVLIRSGDPMTGSITSWELKYTIPSIISDSTNFQPGAYMLSLVVNYEANLVIGVPTRFTALATADATLQPPTGIFDKYTMGLGDPLTAFLIVVPNAAGATGTLTPTDLVTEVTGGGDMAAFKPTVASTSITTAMSGARALQVKFALRAPGAFDVKFTYRGRPMLTPQRTLSTRFLVQDPSNTLTLYEASRDSTVFATMQGAAWGNQGVFSFIGTASPSLSLSTPGLNIDKGIAISFGMAVRRADGPAAFNLNWLNDAGRPELSARWRWGSAGDIAWTDGGVGLRVLSPSSMAVPSGLWTMVLVHLANTELRIFEDGVTRVVIPNRRPVDQAMLNALVAQFQQTTPAHPQQVSAHLSMFRTCPYRFPTDDALPISRTQRDLVLNSAHAASVGLWNVPIQGLPDPSISLGYTPTSLRFFTDSYPE